MARNDNGTATDETAAAIDFGPADSGSVAIDFSGVQDGFEPLPDGDYRLELVAVERGKSKSDNHKFKLTMTCTEPEESGFSGRRVWDDVSLAPKALWKFKQMAVSFGADPDQFSGALTLDQLDELMRSLIGNEALVSLGHHVYSGPDGTAEPRTFQDVNKYKPLAAVGAAGGSGWS